MVPSFVSGAFGSHRRVRPYGAHILAGRPTPEELASAFAGVAWRLNMVDVPPSPGDAPASRGRAPRFDSGVESRLLAGLEDASGPEPFGSATASAGESEGEDFTPGPELGPGPASELADGAESRATELHPPLPDRGDPPEPVPPTEPDLENEPEPFGSATIFAGESEGEDFTPGPELGPGPASELADGAENRAAELHPPLPDRGDPSEPIPPTEPDLESALLDGLEHAPGPGEATAADDPARHAAEPDLEHALLDGLEHAPGPGEATAADDPTRHAVEPDLEHALVDGLEDVPEPDPYSAGTLAGDFASRIDLSAPSAGTDSGQPIDPTPGPPDLEEALLEGLADAPAPAERGADDERSEPAIEPPEEPPDRDPPSAAGDAPDAAPAPEHTSQDEVFLAAGSEPAALAFAADADTESALREGLADLADPQVWPGGLRTAIEVLTGGHTPRIIFVDLDGTAYPAGAIHELAAVCEVGTVVVACGSDPSARFSREILLAGVNDYLVKPITAASVREAAARAANPARDESGGGWSVGFTGTGGSGATTVAAAMALVAAQRGRYVSVLDLNRTFPALSFLLDVEPAAGLVELLSTTARASLHPEMVDGMRVKRTDRIAVYGYPWSAAPPPLAPVWAVCELLVELQRRSHLVLIDGLDDPATRVSLLALVDARVLVVEPTSEGAARAAHLLERFGPVFDEEWPFLLVQNHTRDFKPQAGAAALEGAGLEPPVDVVIPFEPSLPGVADRGWPRGRIPKSLHRSLDVLADRVLAGEKAAAPALA